MNVYQKLNAARTKLHAAGLKKSGRNEFAKYSYFELGDFVPHALRLFDELGLTAVTTFNNDAATMDIINAEKPEEKITFTSPMSDAALKGCHAVQNLGAVQTYLRRYLWTSALEIVENDALDASPPVTVAPVQHKPASQEQLKEIEELLAKTSSNAAKFLKYLKLDSLHDMNAQQFELAKKALQAKMRVAA
jgi:hypothetical protein